MKKPVFTFVITCLVVLSTSSIAAANLERIEYTGSDLAKTTCTEKASAHEAQLCDNSAAGYEKNSFAPALSPVTQKKIHKVYLPIINVPLIYYVSKLGNNEDGKSWETAWNELDQIDWRIIRPGDVILIDGGSTEMVYSSTLEPTASGTPEEPILISLATDPGRNGKAVIFGGRSTPLPYCGQKEYDYQKDNVRSTGIELDDISWVVIDGTKWRGITVHGHNGEGIKIENSTRNLTLRNMEIHDNGRASIDDGAWEPDGPGIRVSGVNARLERMIIHDNGQDAIQSLHDTNLSNLTIRQSWLYNGRQHPTVDESYNWCAHTDGLQIYNGGVVSGVLIEESIIGPGFTNGIILGDRRADVYDVTLRNLLFTKGADNNIHTQTASDAKRWVVDHVTAHCPNTKWHCLRIQGDDHTVTNSIFYGSKIYFPDNGLENYSGNCQWKTNGFDLGQEVDPQFVDANDNDPFSLDNYALRSGSPCAGAGSSITSVSQLLSLP